MWKSSAITETAAPNVFSATAVIAATAIIEDAAGAATVMVAAVAITQDATRAAMSGDNQSAHLFVLVFFLCGNYGNNGGKDSGDDRGGRGNSDNPRRDEGVDADWKAITTVVVVAIVADAALIIAAKKVLQATAVVAPTAMIQDVMRSAMSPRSQYRSDGAEDCGDYGESFYSDRGGRGGSDYPGLDEGGKVSLEAMTAVVAEAMVPKTAGNGSDSAGDVFKATTVVTAVVITKDATKASCKGSSSDRDGRGDSDYPGRDEGSDVVKKVMTAGVVVAMVADAVAKSDGAEDVGNYGDSGGQVSYGTGGGAALAMTQDAKMAENDGSEDFGNYGDSGCEAGEVTAVVGGSDDPGRDEGGDAALEEITAVDVVAIVAADAMVRKTPAINGDSSSEGTYGSEDCGNYGGNECESSYGDRGGRGNGDNLWTQQGRRFNLGGDNYSSSDAMVQKTVAITATVGAKCNYRGDSDNPGRDDCGDVA
ncbi:hypothetical protein Bbelb_276760 [Branchiostoma belcheri]|nr:hypothetical protein Bbelb_276760 [Branchiostoma belcheri]